MDYRLCPHRLRLIALFLVFPAGGCREESGVKTIPVTGVITVDGLALRAENATVVFKPAKGNPTLCEPYGSVDETGRYVLSIRADQEGAPLGWYQVIVSAYESPENVQSFPGKPATHYHLLVNRKYADAKTSELFVEVVENPKPNAYDLHLKR